MSYLHQILVAATIALPFLLVRIIHTGLNAINQDTSDSSGHTTKFNPIAGDWVLYLVLGLFMEIAVVAVYAMTAIGNLCDPTRTAKSSEASSSRIKGSYSSFVDIGIDNSNTLTASE